MSATKVFGERNIFQGSRVLASAGKENLDDDSRKRSLVKSRAHSLVEDGTAASFAIFEEKLSEAKPEVSDASVQTTGKFDSTSDEKKNVAFPNSSPSDADLITEDEPSADYWKRLAEARRDALAEALEENERLCNELEEKKAENADIAKERDELAAKVSGLEVELREVEELLEEYKQLSEALQTQEEVEDETEGDDDVNGEAQEKKDGGGDDDDKSVKDEKDEETVSEKNQKAVKK